MLQKPEDSRSGIAGAFQFVGYGCALGVLALEHLDFYNTGVFHCH